MIAYYDVWLGHPKNGLSDLCHLYCHRDISPQINEIAYGICQPTLLEKWQVIRLGQCVIVTISHNLHIVGLLAKVYVCYGAFVLFKNPSYNF